MAKHKTIQRVEDASALAITARQRLTALGVMLDNIHQQGRALSDYNRDIAAQDIAEAIGIIWQLQNEIRQFRGDRT